MIDNRALRERERMYKVSRALQTPQYMVEPPYVEADYGGVTVLQVF
jgi:hypothetical protein